MAIPLSCEVVASLNLGGEGWRACPRKKEGGLGLGKGGGGSRLMEMAPVLRRHSNTILQPAVFRESVPGACRLSVRAVRSGYVQDTCFKACLGPMY